MGRQSVAETRFREQVRRERKGRHWSQEEFSKLLRSKGLDHILASTVAKIESGERAVRIDEAAAIADLLEVGLDALLGRKVGVENDLLYTFRGVLDAARTASGQVEAIRLTLRERFGDLLALDFSKHQIIESDATAALRALDDAAAALGRVGEFRLSAKSLKIRMERSMEAQLNTMLDVYLNESRGLDLEAES